MTSIIPHRRERTDAGLTGLMRRILRPKCLSMTTAFETASDASASYPDVTQPSAEL